MNYKKIIGYHGTDAKNEDSILKNNFEESSGEHQQLGNGVYFFIEKIFNPPDIDAKNWAIVNSWDNIKKTNKYSNYIVLEAEIKLNENSFLDLDTEEGLEIFNIVRNAILEKIKIAKKKKLKNDLSDSAIIEEIKKRTKIEIVKKRMYSKLTPYERKSNFFSRIPNVSILVVSSPIKNINKHTIKIKNKGEIKNDS